MLIEMLVNRMIPTIPWTCYHVSEFWSQFFCYTFYHYKMRIKGNEIRRWTREQFYLENSQSIIWSIWFCFSYPLPCMVALAWQHVHGEDRNGSRWWWKYWLTFLVMLRGEKKEEEKNESKNCYYFVENNQLCLDQ